MQSWPLQFGGPLPSILDTSGARISPRCFGNGELVAQDPAAFAAASASAGGPDAMVAWVNGAIVRALGEALAARCAEGGAMKAVSAFARPEPAAEIAGVVSAQLAQARATVQINTLNVTLSDEDREALMAAVKDAAMRNRQEKMREIAAAQGGAAAPPANAHAPGELAPGTRVLATWTDGRSYPGTVQRTQNGYHEITWDAGGNAWVPLAQVQPR
jgi:hypothetical protein